MAWVFLAVSLAFAALVVNAFVPVRREPLSAVSFAFGWIPGELPIHVLVVEVGVTVGFAVTGVGRTWPWWLGIGISVVSWAGLIRLAVAAAGAGPIVRRALDDAGCGPDAVVGFDPTPRWNRWWRLVLAVPFRFRGIRRIRNVDYWGDGNYRHKLDVLRKRRVGDRPCPVVVYIHGGAWVMGDKRQQGIPFMHELVQRGWVCVAINYRLSPRATWPAHIVDCKRALAWVRAHIAEYGGDPGFIAVAGGSAGGHLAALAALTPGEQAWQPGFEDEDTRVDACVPSYGVFDMTGAPDRFGAFGPGALELLEQKVMKVRYADDPDVFGQASPDRRVTPDAPPMFVLQGTNDTLVPPSVARFFVDRLSEVSPNPVAYAELPFAQHAFDVLASVRGRHAAMGAVLFLEGMRARAGRRADQEQPGGL